VTRGTAIGLSVALAGAALGCRSTGNEPAPVTSTPTVFSPPPASASAAIRPTEPPHPLDQLFRGYENELPAPATLSEGNGASLKCPHHGHVTYTLLDATAQRLPLERDADVARLVRWYRDDDPCIRYIAVEALLRKIVHDRDRLSLSALAAGHARARPPPVSRHSRIRPAVSGHETRRTRPDALRRHDRERQCE
jgi:hypothetical protein